MKKLDNRGLSLIELVVSVSLLSVIMLTVFSVMDFGQKSFYALNKSGDIQTQASNIVSFISSQVRECRNITSSGSSSSLELINKDGQSVKFEWDGSSALMYFEDDVKIRSLSSDIQSMEFVSSKDSVEITIQLKSDGESFKLKTSVYRRY